MIFRTIFLIALSLGFASVGSSYDRDKNPIKITKSTRTQALSPEEQLAKFTLADGFVIELVASEKNGIIRSI